MDSQWLSLAEYSSKYNISVSTLRRRIRSGQLSFNVEFGKYFLKDQSLIELKESNIENPKFHKSTLSFKKEVNDLKKDVAQREMTDLRPENSLLDKLMNVQKELYEKIEIKELKILEQQSQIADLNTLVAFLEKENKELKAVLHQEKEIEEWLELR